MNILRGRFESAINALADYRSLSEEDIESRIEDVENAAEIFNRIIEAGDRPSLLFVNETYLVRHFLTQAFIELRGALSLINEDEADAVRARDDALQRARQFYQAALMSLNAAEQLLPPQTRTIGGESFWDRFARVRQEREGEAARLLVQTTSSQRPPDH